MREHVHDTVRDSGWLTVGWPTACPPTGPRRGMSCFGTAGGPSRPRRGPEREREREGDPGTSGIVTRKGQKLAQHTTCLA